MLLSKTLHETTFQYLVPSDAQVTQMIVVREASAVYANVLQDTLPDGPDKTYLLRMVREIAMWANVSITREADGTPRIGATV